MKSNCAFKILPEYSLIISSYSGKISEKDIMSMKGSIKNDQDFRLNYNVLDDFSDADFDITDESFNQVLLWLKENFAWDRNSAVLTSTPNQVVNIIRFDSVNKNQLPNRIKIFSTLTAALQWIGLSNENLSSIQLVLEELKA